MTVSLRVCKLSLVEFQPIALYPTVTTVLALQPRTLQSNGGTEENRKPGNLRTRGKPGLW